MPAGGTMRTAVFIIPGTPPSPNRYLGHHYRAMAASRQEWRTRGALARIRAARSGTWDGKPFDRAAVTMRWYYQDRRRHDPDNAASSVKSLWDMFRPRPGESVDGYPLPDDDFAHVPTLTVEYGGVDRRNPRIEVYIRELAPDIANGQGGVTA